MADVRFTEQAIADLEDIFVYTIETFGELQAERYKASLERVCRRIADDPRLGRPIAGASRSFFHYPCESHIVFYMKQSDGVLIVRILHAAMDFVRHLP